MKLCVDRERGDGKAGSTDKARFQTFFNQKTFRRR